MEKLTVPKRSICAAVVLWFVKNQDSIKFRESCPESDREIYAMTDKVIELKGKIDLDTKDFSIDWGIGGYTSDDIESFIGHFILFGLATEEPLDLSEPALDLCREILHDDHKAQPAELEKLVQALELGFFD